jgi:hypothetical protein
MSKPTTIKTLTKRCVDCRETKPAAAFFSTATTPDRLTHRCKECVLAAGQHERAKREARKERA